MSRLFMLLLLLGLWPGSAAAVEPAPIWPLDLPTRYLTSNFMEYRPGRFHAGLDLKTQTVNGFAAHAVEDGWIVRVRATPGAYGRAIYLRGASGRTYVYAHLSRFNDVLRARVAIQRARTGTYRARLEFKPGEIRVRQGEVLGLTGQSGTGGPHLHFEVRDAHNRPTDPQSLGFAVGDTMPPVIYQLRAWPATAAAVIEGQIMSHLLSAQSGLTGEQPALHVTGPVAFSARIVDHADIRGHRLEPSLIEVWLDGQRVYRCHNEHFDFAENALERLEWVVLPGVREHWLHRQPADSLTGRLGGLWYLGAEAEGLVAGRHQVRVLAEDQAGNRTETHFELIVGVGVPAGSSGRSAWQADPVSPSFASADSLSIIRITPFFDVDSETVRAERPQLVQREFRPEQGDPVMAPLSLWSDVSALTARQRETANKQGLQPLGPGRNFVAAGWPLEASLPVAIETPSDPVAETWGLYRWHDDEWSWVAGWNHESPAGGKVAVTIDRPGLHAVLDDAVPPWINVPDPGLTIGLGLASTVAGVTAPVWAVLPVGVQDRGSGVAAETIRVQLDGTILIVEPDLPRDRILIEFPAEMAVGTHNVVIEAADEAGRMARREFTFQAVR